MSDEPRRLLDDRECHEALRRDLAEEARASWDYDAVAGLAALQDAIRSGASLPVIDAPDPQSLADPPEPPEPPPGGPSPGGPPLPRAPTASSAGLGAGGVVAAAPVGLLLKAVIVGLAALVLAAGIAVFARSPAPPGGSSRSAPSSPLAEANPPAAETPKPAAEAPPPSSVEPSEPMISAAAPLADGAPRPSSSASREPSGSPAGAPSSRALPSSSPLTMKSRASSPRSTSDGAGAAADGAGAEADGAGVAADEIEHMRALRERAASDPGAALLLAAEDERRFKGGLFALEREFIVISSLARLGRSAEARARGDRFIAAHPTSPYADRIRALVP